MGAPPIACDLSVFSPAERAQHEEASRKLFASVATVVELPDGYALTFDGTAYWALAAEFVELERRCCPFFGFELALRHNSVRLSLTGPQGAKELLQVEVLPQVAASGS